MEAQLKLGGSAEPEVTNNVFFLCKVKKKNKTKE